MHSIRKWNLLRKSWLKANFNCIKLITFEHMSCQFYNRRAYYQNKNIHDILESWYSYLEWSQTTQKHGITRATEGFMDFIKF